MASMSAVCYPVALPFPCKRVVRTVRDRAGIAEKECSRESESVEDEAFAVKPVDAQCCVLALYAPGPQVFGGRDGHAESPASASIASRASFFVSPTPRPSSSASGPRTTPNQRPDGVQPYRRIWSRFFPAVCRFSWTDADPSPVMTFFSPSGWGPRGFPTLARHVFSYRCFKLTLSGVSGRGEQTRPCDRTSAG